MFCKGGQSRDWISEKNDIFGWSGCFVESIEKEVFTFKNSISQKTQFRKSKSERKERKIAKKRTETSATEETINLIELDEDETFKQEYVEDVVETNFENEVQNLTIEKIAASKGLSGALQELQLGRNLASATYLQKNRLTDTD